MSEHFPEVIGWNSVVLYTVQYTCTAVHLRNEVRVELPSKVLSYNVVVQRTEVRKYFRTFVLSYESIYFHTKVRKYIFVRKYFESTKVKLTFESTLRVRVLSKVRLSYNVHVHNGIISIF